MGWVGSTLTIGKHSTNGLAGAHGLESPAAPAGSASKLIFQVHMVASVSTGQINQGELRAIA